jgi:hypothetical protein
MRQAPAHIRVHDDPSPATPIDFVSTVERQTLWSFYSTPETEEMPPWSPRMNSIIEAVSIAANDIATGDSIVDINVDGTTIFSVTLPTGQEYVYSAVTPEVTVEPGQLVTVQYDTIGDGLSNVTIHVWWRNTE